jgi:hypothetical protein
MRKPRPRVIVGLLAIALLAAFLIVKLAPSSHAPRVDVQAEGRDRAFTRRTLATELEKLFRGSNGPWRVGGRSKPLSQSPCARRPYPTSIGRANTATYEFARWLELRLFDYIYPSVVEAQRAFGEVDVGRTETCRAKTFAFELRHSGYTVSKARGFSSNSVQIADEARSMQFEIPSRYGKRSYDWHLDLTEVLRGRVIVAAGTVVGRAFAQGDRLMAADLAKAAGSPR